MSSTVRIYVQIDRMRMQQKRQAEKTAREAKKLRLKVQYAEKKGGKDNHISHCIYMFFES